MGDRYSVCLQVDGTGPLKKSEHQSLEIVEIFNFFSNLIKFKEKNFFVRTSQCGLYSVISSATIVLIFTYRA